MGYSIKEIVELMEEIKKYQRENSLRTKKDNIKIRHIIQPLSSLGDGLDFSRAHVEAAEERVYNDAKERIKS